MSTNDPDWLSDDNGNRVGVEYWVPVPEFCGYYEVSTAGRLRSCDRLNVNCNGVRRLLRGRILSTPADSEGYSQVELFRGDGVGVKARVHRLVALVFKKNPTGLPLVDHRNRDRRDNRVANLRWVSYSENRRNVAEGAS